MRQIHSFVECIRCEVRVTLLSVTYETLSGIAPRRVQGIDERSTTTAGKLSLISRHVETYACVATPTSVDDLKAVVMLTVSIDVHTYSHLRFRTLLKAAFRVCVRQRRHSKPH